MAEKLVTAQDFPIKLIERDVSRRDSWVEVKVFDR